MLSKIVRLLNKAKLSAWGLQVNKLQAVMKT